MRANAAAVEGKIFGLDFVRACAISMVVVGHALGPFNGRLPRVAYLGGFAGWGVELFFVLSGFLIGGILVRMGPQLSRWQGLGLFYIRRWMRTLPIFLMFWAIAVFIEHRFKSHTVQVGEGLGHLFFLKTFYSIDITFLPESWSLAVEEWFYLLFPLSIWLLLKRKVSFDRVFLGMAFLFLAASTLLRVQFAYAHPEADWTFTPRCTVIMRFDALMYGVLAAWWAERHPMSWRAMRYPTLIAGALLSYAVYRTLFAGRPVNDFFYKTFRFSLISIGFALLLPWFSAWSLRRENFMSRGIRKVALWSYVIYLLHLNYYFLLGKPLILDDGTTQFGGWRMVAVMVLGAFAGGGLISWLVERPVMAWRERVTAAYRRRWADGAGHVP